MKPTPRQTRPVQPSLLFGLCCCSVLKLCLALCDPMDCSMPGFPVLHYLLRFAQTYAYWIGDAIQPSHSVVPFSSSPQSFPASGSFSISWLFASGGQSIAASASASASVLPINKYWGLISFRIDWFDLFAVRGTLKSLQHHNSKASILWCCP